MKKLFIETYGCQMNVADSEVVASIMKSADYDVCTDISDADAVFLNTCSVRENAEQKIYNRLEALNALRRSRKGRLIIGGPNAPRRICSTTTTPTSWPGLIHISCCRSS